jgi:CTP:molybdopterin cytidylyltransferase MocA
MLADMPLVTTPLLRCLLALGARACCAYPDGRPGVPALFGPADYPALMALEGDAGAGRLLRALPRAPAGGRITGAFRCRYATRPSARRRPAGGPS